MNAQDFADRVSFWFDAEVQRREEVTRQDPAARGPVLIGARRFSLVRWYQRGTAGKVRDWFRDEAGVHPTDTPEELVERVAERCDAEVIARPRWYTKRHMLDVLRLAGDLADAA